MRTILILCVLSLAGGAYFAWRAMQLPNNFGEFTGAPEVAVADVLEKPRDYVGKTVAVHGQVKEQCKAMGCFFFLASAKGNLRVELKDIAMDAPMREGRPARVEGQIVTYSDGYQLWASAIEFQ